MTDVNQPAHRISGSSATCPETNVKNEMEMNPAVHQAIQHDTSSMDEPIGNAVARDFRSRSAEESEAGRHIDPATAEVGWDCIEWIDHAPPPEETYGNRIYFARAPGSDIWVSFRDLPADTRDALLARQRSRDLEAEQFLVMIKEQIDPATAEIDSFYADYFDTCGEGNPFGFRDFGMEYFARSPGSDIWVAFRDLPADTRRALESRMSVDGQDGGGPRAPKV